MSGKGAILRTYRYATALLEPAAAGLLVMRQRRGKEDPERVSERRGHPGVKRPNKPLVWLHGASVGETVTLLECLASGLRRLPSHHGPVLLGCPVGEDALSVYRPGAELYEPAPVAALASDAVDLGGGPEFAVWSTTARRTSAFGSPDVPPRVVFVPGTRFTVLDVRAAAEGRPARVLLRETDGPAPDRDRTVRERLDAFLARRDLVPAERRRPLDHPGHYRLAPGVDLP